MNLKCRVRAKHLSAELAPVLEVRIVFMHTFVVAQVGQAVLQKTVAGIVQDALRLLLQQFKGVERRGVHVVSGSDDSTRE